MRKAFFVGGTAVLAAASLIVPLPVLAMRPGPVLPTAERVTIPARPGTINGQLLGTTVTLSEAPLAAALAGLADPHTRLLRRPAVIPRGVDVGEFRRFQERLFEESATTAKAVGLRQAGVAVEVTGGGARVTGVVEASPADGRLYEGDVITAADGRPVTVAADLVAATARARAGQRVALAVMRAGRAITVDVSLAVVTVAGRPALGVLVDSVGLEVRLPYDVDVAAEGVGGPSAGLMLSLAVYDLVSAEDLTRGRVIAGTGTVDLAGRVGPVGGVAQKVEAARRAGASVFVVGAAEAGEAIAAAGDGLRILAVETIEDAIEHLRR